MARLGAGEAEGAGEAGEVEEAGGDGGDEEVNSKLYLTCSLFPVPCSLTNDQ
ncbi:MAG: hypothetical protein RID53_19855 [Coleofasciculus sp. B1-GNL1-01]|uniref:hypothetical protein n=1 Tax=Coleofasciculus sp. B1-GNL1-01 TaxID=3068484 RepID=UPI0032F46AF7